MDNIGKDIEKAAKEIKKGNLVVFPTETVYGIGANALDEEAVKKIFIAKNRPQDNPLILHVSSIEMAKKYSKDINEVEENLMKKFFPGPLSIVLKKNHLVPNIVTAGLDTVSIRMPNNEYAIKLIEKSGIPIAAPSANKSGKPSGTTIDDIYDELKDSVSYFIDGGETEIGIESTVVKVDKNGKIIILRPGKVTKEDLEQISEVEVDKNCFEKVNNCAKVLSPGMKHRHYAPKAKCILLNIENKEKLIDKINEIAKISNESTAFMLMDDVISELDNKIKVYNLGSSMEDVSRNIFRFLRKVDSDNVSVCYIQSVKKEGLGLGIMNRIIRACEYNTVEK